MRRTAVATSGPMPSPAISVTLCLMTHPIVGEAAQLVERHASALLRRLKPVRERAFVVAQSGKQRCAPLLELCYTGIS